MPTNPDIVAYTDGGARGNPGPAGAGVYIVDASGAMIAEASEYLGERTNNWAEYEAVARALEAIKKKYGKRTKEMHIELRMDSELVAKQLRGEYQIKEETLFPQFIRIWNLRVSQFPHLTITHVPREENKEADKRANAAMDSAEQ